MTLARRGITPEVGDYVYLNPGKVPNLPSPGWRRVVGVEPAAMRGWIRLTSWELLVPDGIGPEESFIVPLRHLAVRREESGEPERRWPPELLEPPAGPP